MKKLIIFTIGFVTVLATSWALLHQGFFRVHDYVHAARIVEMLRGFQEGQLPVRWSSNFGYGYGMPLFEFYAPLPYIVGAAFFGLGIGVVNVIKLLFLLANIFTFIGAFLLGQRLYGQLGGSVTAVLYTLAPYRAVNLYVRGALSEAWAMIALPWMILGIVLLIQEDRRGFWVLFGGLIVLLLSHNLTTLLFLPMSVIITVILFLTLPPKGREVPWLKRLQTTIPIIGAYLLSIGVSAFYLFPAYLEKDFTRIGNIFSGYFTYSNHFLYVRQFITPYWGYGGSNWGPEDGISFFLGYGHIAALLFAAVAWVYVAVNKRNPRGIWWMLGLGVLFGASLTMTMARTQPIWEAISILATLQFPWRWLSMTSFLLALIGGAGVAIVPNKRYRILAALILSAITLTTTWVYFRPEAYLENPAEFYYTDAELIQRDMSTTLPDYISNTMAEETPPREEIFLVPHVPEEHVNVLENLGHRKVFKTSFLGDTAFNPLIASYPGWKATIDGAEVPVENTGEYGTLLLNVPPGEHEVEVFFDNTPIRAVSDAISATSIIIMIMLGVATYAGYRRTTT